MKFYNSLLLIFIVIFFSCETEKKKVTIIGKVTGETPESIEYTIPIHGSWFYGSKQSIKSDSIGNFKIDIDVDSPSFITLYGPKGSNGTLIVEPEKTYNVNFNPESKYKKFLVEGETSEAQNIYNTLPNPDFNIFALNEFLNDSITSAIVSKLETAKKKELQLFDELFQEVKISEGFLSLVNADRNCYYDALQGNIAKYNFTKSYIDNNEGLKMNSLDLWHRVFKGEQKTFSKSINSPWFYALAENYIKYREYTNKSFDFNELTKMYNEGYTYSNDIQKSKKYLNNGLEYFNASYIYYWCWQNKDNSKELIELYNNFKNEYPNSQYNKYLTPIVKPIEDFHQKIEEVALNDKYKFIDNYKNINSFEELTKAVSGKKTYIDIWGTWCAPCKEEFKYKNDLNQLLKSKNINTLYICEGRNSKEKVWKEMIKGYELNGYHIMANEKLMADIFNIFGQNGAFSFPRYILIDENGEIIFENAKRPSEIKELAESINIF